jgi:hypothetical protein
MIVTVVMVIVTVMVTMLNVCLRTRDRADRECGSGKGGQNESKFSHENYSSGRGFLIDGIQASGEIGKQPLI